MSVLIVEDHGVLRDGLRAILDSQRDIRLVASVGDGASALRETERHQPKVVILGVTPAGQDGADTARDLVARLPGVGVILLAAQASPAGLRRALEAGANGYLARESSGEEMVRAVRAVAAGTRYLGQGLAEGFIGTSRGAGTSEPLMESLTATERNILKLVANGMSNPRAAQALGLSRRTVETYRLRLMRKLGIGDLATLVKYAIRHGIVTLD